MTNDSTILKDQGQRTKMKGQIKKAQMTNDSTTLKEKGERTKIKDQI